MAQVAEVSVFYVARGIDAGLEAVRSFVDAWNEYPPLCHHQLYFLAKGWPIAEQRDEMIFLAEKCGAKLLNVSDFGYDWGAYFQALPSVGTEWICLMNSYSRPQATGWLSLLLNAATTQGNGLAGATGSWESLWGTRAPTETIKTSLRRWLRALKNHSSWRHFEAFPNPHLRSTGLLLRRSLLESFAGMHPPPRNKLEALRLESGRDGLSRFAQGSGCRLTVVGQDGRFLSSSDWPSSGTFRSYDQRNLLISDNRTRDYAGADAQTRAYLEKLAWGQPDK